MAEHVWVSRPLIPPKGTPAKGTRSARVNSSILIDTTVPAYPYYPPNTPSPAIVNIASTHDVDYDFQGGGEVRFGTTFGCPRSAGYGPVGYRGGNDCGCCESVSD